MKKNNPTGPRILRLLKNCYYDFRYGGRLLLVPPKNGDEERGIHPSQPSDYAAMTKLFSLIEVRPEDVIVDIGCGQGRLFSFLLRNGLANRAIGIEVDRDIARTAARRFRRYQQIEIVQGNVLSHVPVGTIYYLFNPFSEEILTAFLQRLEKRLIAEKSPTADRPIVVYYNCAHLDVFSRSGLWAIQRIDRVSFSGLPGAILQFRPRVSASSDAARAGRLI